MSATIFTAEIFRHALYRRFPRCAEPSTPKTAGTLQCTVTTEMTFQKGQLRGWSWSIASGDFILDYWKIPYIAARGYGSRSWRIDPAGCPAFASFLS
jgi:hypothetical protein